MKKAIRIISFLFWTLASSYTAFVGISVILLPLVHQHGKYGPVFAPNVEVEHVNHILYAAGTATALLGLYLLYETWKAAIQRVRRKDKPNLKNIKPEDLPDWMKYNML